MESRRDFLKILAGAAMATGIGNNEAIANRNPFETQTNLVNAEIIESIMADLSKRVRINLDFYIDWIRRVDLFYRAINKVDRKKAVPKDINEMGLILLKDWNNVVSSTVLVLGEANLFFNRLMFSSTDGGFVDVRTNIKIAIEDSQKDFGLRTMFLQLQKECLDLKINYEHTLDLAHNISHLYGGDPRPITGETETIKFG